MQALPIEHDISLQQFNTFGIPARARRYLRVEDPAQLAALTADPVLAALPRLVLGGGSNLLITRAEVDSLVLHMALTGKEIVGQTPDAILVRARAGENWHAFVQWTLDQGLGGLENLSLIPGTVGASPIQNIGAYGAEVKDLFHSLTAFDFATGATRTMDAAACRFAYRDSVFKHEAGRELAVLDVTFALPRAWAPNLRYAELAKELDGIAGPSPRQVADAVIAIRRRKLPDPAEIGNAGSFFKNPVVPGEHCLRLLEQAHAGAPRSARWQRKTGGRLAHRPVRLEGQEPGPRRGLSEAGAGAGEQWRRQRRRSAGAGARDPGGCAGALWGAAGAGAGDGLRTVHRDA
jgi:UDP-N-acetylmuramate dehydrogenase